MIDFKPSSVDLLASFPPLVGTMKRTELETAAAIIVRALQRTSNEWRAISFEAVKEVYRSDCAAGREPIAGMARNPFCRPDFSGLITRGFAVLSSPADRASPIAFTEAGLEAMRRWVR